MTDRDSPPLPSPNAANQRRRSSFSAQGLADLFSSRPSMSGQSGQNGNRDANGQSKGPSAYPGPITSAAAQANQRRLSLTTLGLSGSPNQTSPFLNRPRGESLSSSTSGSVDESPFEDDAMSASASSGNSMPTTPFGRRLSFGARALRDVRNGNGSASGSANGEGFNFADNLRSRAERSSISAQGSSVPSQPAPPHHRAKSVATMEPPIREIPKPKGPDAFQERILKGDFYMD